MVEYREYPILYTNNIISIENILFSILIILLVSDSYKKINFKFKYPILFAFVSYCIFSALFTPTLYATANLGEGRLTNIIYYNYFWFMIINIYYMVGWIRNKLLNKKMLNEKNLIKDKNIIILFTSAICMFAILFTFKSTSFYVTTKSIVNDEAKIYDNECKQRIKILENKNIKNVEFAPFSVYPKALFFSDITTNPSDFRNTSLKQVYKKDNVILVVK